MSIVSQIKGDSSTASNTSMTTSMAGSYRIGFSIGEKDYLKYNHFVDNNSSFYFVLNTVPIYIGYTRMYEPDYIIDNPSFSFPLGLPQSAIIELVKVE